MSRGGPQIVYESLDFPKAPWLTSDNLLGYKLEAIHVVANFDISLRILPNLPPNPTSLPSNRFSLLQASKEMQRRHSIVVRFIWFTHVH